MDITRTEENAIHPQKLSLSRDSYIRMSLEELSDLPFVHLASDCDAGFLAELQMQTVPASAAGFSEWISATKPVISMGWGWFIHSRSGQMLPAPDGVRSNLMFVDVRGYDLGTAATSNLLMTWLATYPWQAEVASALDIAGELSALSVT